MPGRLLRRIGFTSVSVTLGVLLAGPAWGATVKWKGYDWTLTEGGMAGVANGAASNVSVDADGYLHLNVTKNGTTWTASELFTTQQLGFGTYQWQIEGPVDVFDKNIVLGLFPYGPAAGIGTDGTNEIDLEFSRWGQASGPNVDFTDYPSSGAVVGETSFTISLGGATASTARFTWTSSSIESSVLSGYQPIASDTGLLKQWKYAPNNPSVNIPQQALPLGMNLWCFDIPSNGQNVEIVLRDFQFVKAGDPLPGDGSGGVANGGAGAGAPSGGGGVANGGAGAGAPSGGGGVANGGAGAAGAPSGGSMNGVGNASGVGASGAGTAVGGSGSAGGAVSASGSAATPGDSQTDSACGCRAAGSSQSAHVGWLAVMGAISALGARRRRRQSRAVRR